MIDKNYTVKEVLDILRISRATLYRLIKNDHLRPIKLRGKTLFTESELKRLLKNSERK